jgi:hypothetical protein
LLAQLNSGCIFSEALDFSRKFMKFHVQLLAVGAAAVFATFWSPAQQGEMPAMGGPSGMDAAMIQFFGDIKEFSASADITVTTGNQTAVMPTKFALLDKQIRMEINLGQAKGQQLPADVVAQIKQIGLDEIVVLAAPAKQSILMIYPRLKSYAEMKIPPEKAAAAAEDAKVTKTELGKEKVGGQDCVKNKVVVTDKNGKQHEATVWNAPALKGFPVQIKMKEQEADVAVLFQDVKLAKPEAKLFDTPADYTRYNTIQELMMAAAMKMLQEK